MISLDYSYFFDLSTFAHAQLLMTQEAVWTSLARLSSYLNNQTLGDINVDVPHGAYLIDAHLISIGIGTVVEPGAYIKGPCIIGSNCTIRHGAYIRGNVVIGNHCVVGHDTEIKHSIMLDHSHAAHFAYLGDTIVGNRVNLGAGVKCANLTLKNKGSIKISHQGQHIDTGLRKLGAIIGDGSQVGCNAVTNPGTLLGKGVFCDPVINVSGFVPSNSIVKNPCKPSISTRSSA